MPQAVRFVDTPNGPIVVVDVEPLLLMDEVSARQHRRSLSRALGNISVLLRCRIGSSVLSNGDLDLQRYATDPYVDIFPLVMVDLEAPIQEAA